MDHDLKTWNMLLTTRNIYTIFCYTLYTTNNKQHQLDKIQIKKVHQLNKITIVFNTNNTQHFHQYRSSNSTVLSLEFPELKTKWQLLTAQVFIPSQHHVCGI